MIEELTAEQRWLWIGLLLMAGDSSIPGTVYRRKNDDGVPIGFSDVTIAETLDVSLECFHDGIERMKAKDKISVDANGVIHITNWAKYQSEYQRQKPYRMDKKEGYKSDCNQSNEVEGEGDVEGEGEGEEDTPPTRLTSFQEWEGKTIGAWNAFAVKNGLAQILRIVVGSSRYKALKARHKDKNFDIDAILSKAQSQPFLLGMGRSDKGWTMTFDWIIKPSNYIKVLEGQYMEKRPMWKGDFIGKTTHKMTEAERLGYRESFIKELKKDKNITDEEVKDALAEWDRKNPPIKE